MLGKTHFIKQNVMHSSTYRTRQVHSAKRDTQAGSYSSSWIMKTLTALVGMIKYSANIPTLANGLVGMPVIDKLSCVEAEAQYTFYDSFWSTAGGLQQADSAQRHTSKLVSHFAGRLQNSTLHLKRMVWDWCGRRPRRVWSLSKGWDAGIGKCL